MGLLLFWQAGAAPTDFTGSWTQPAASWAATTAAALTSTGAFTQATATWSASAAEDVAAAAAWAQAAASWDVSLAETLTATASWAQDAASWSASAAQSLDATASFVQAAASWDALADSADNSFTGSWLQAAASWDAVADTPLPTGGQVGHLRALRFDTPLRRRPPRTEVDHLPEHIGSVAVFVQPAASWHAEMDTYDPDALFLLFDEPALIGAR